MKASDSHHHKNHWVLWKIGLIASKGFYLFLVLVSQIIKPQAVLFGIHNRTQLCLQQFTFSRVQQVFEHRILHPLPIVHTLFCNLPEPLDFLLSHYNDGRRKNLFCVAVNLLTIKEIENILQTVKSDKDFQSMGKKEQASVIAKLLQDIAASKGIELKLRKK